MWFAKKKDLTGIEPVTYRSAVGCSTTELKVRLTAVYDTIPPYKAVAMSNYIPHGNLNCDSTLYFVELNLCLVSIIF